MADGVSIPFWQHLIMVGLGGLLAGIPTIIANHQHNKSQAQREYNQNERYILERVIEDIEQYDSIFMMYYYQRVSTLQIIQKGNPVAEYHKQKEDDAAESLISSASYPAKAKANLLLIKHANTHNDVQDYFQTCTALASRMLDPNNPPDPETINHEVNNLQIKKQKIYDTISQSYKSIESNTKEGLLKQIPSFFKKRQSR